MQRPIYMSAFTLIELLVVITIIVVLLALLTPALDKAIYQAELAVCGAQTRTIAQAALMYAAQNKRRYPYRIGADLGGFWHPHKLSNGGGTDERGLLKSYLSLNKVMADPLMEEVDLENSLNGTQVYSAYYLWYGFGYGGQAKMSRIGDRLTWTEDGETHRFNVLASDQDDIRFSGGNVMSSHPDREGVLSFFKIQDAGGISVPVGDIGGANNYTLARWQSDGSRYRGDSDYNYAYDDGSVARFEAVTLNDDDNPDSRFVRVGTYNNDTETVTDWTQLPAR